IITAFEVMEKGLPFVWQQMEKLITTQPLYLSLDLDVLDASSVPGVENPEPGGISSRELLYLIEKIAPYLDACDIVELSGETDPADITAKTAARIVLDIIGNYIQKKQ
ncbi:MAG: arginase family protein, partial [Spirochaetes bacterium]|nr:arginase family protein [Spirochaetota bacterium]